MKATQLPSGKYRVQVLAGHDEKGKRIIKSFTAEREWEALKMADEYLNNGHRSDYRAVMTVADAFEEYISSRDNLLSPSTIQGYRVIQRSRLQSIMNIRITELSFRDIQTAVNFDSRRLSRKSIKSALALLKSALALQDVEINMKKVTLPPAKKKKVELPSAEDVIKAVIGSDIELPCLLAMWLSLRISEVLGLQFGDISKIGRYITVNRVILTINGHSVLNDRTKTEESTRTNLLPKYLRDKIAEIPHEKDTEFIIKMSYKQISARFNKIMAAHGYNITFHKLRHEFATTLDDLGVPSDYIQKIGGRSTDNIMKSVYTHTTKNKETEYQNMIDGFFNKAISSVT